MNDRLSRISSNAEIFDNEKEPYQNALNDCGYEYTLQFNQNAHRKRGKNRKRNIIWFTPPFSVTIKTPIGKNFLNLLDRCFPKKNPLHKIFNRNTVKIGYRTLKIWDRNYQTIIAKS